MIKLNKPVILTLCSNLFHYYAFSVYAFSAIILSPVFFPTDNLQFTKILGLVSVCITLLIKPLGGVIFGHIGDRYGRKQALILSLLTITFATTCIGFIPTFSVAGFYSSISLLLCLSIQGMCLGGQYTGALIFVQEHTQKQHAAFACGLVIAFGIFGTLLGTVTSFFFSYFNTLNWVWRIPFFISFFIGLTFVYLMKNLKESSLFVEKKEREPANTLPLMGIIKNYKRELFSSIAISSIPISLFYIATVYIPNFYFNEKNDVGHLDSLGIACIAQAFCLVFVPLFGLMGDKIGRGKQLRYTTVLILVSPFFLFPYIASHNGFYSIILGSFFFSILISLYSGPGPTYLLEKFPVIGRYSGMGFGITVGEGLFGGLAPIICATLEQTFDSKIAPAFFIFFLGIISYAGLIGTKEKMTPPTKGKEWRKNDSSLQPS